MTDSLRDQLKKLGFTSSAPAASKPQQTRHRTDAKKRNAQPPNKDPRRPAKKGARPAAKDGVDIDLARAYAIRAQKEKQDRINAEQQKQEQARIRREARQKLEQLLDGKALNKDDADIARHFEYGGKIRRLYVTAEQLSALNRGELGVIQMRGRYVLVDLDTLTQAETIFAEAVALKVDPLATVDDAYADPNYRVPDDLVW